MTTSEYDDDQKAERMKANMARIEELTARLTHALAQRDPPRGSLQAPDSDIFVQATAAFWTEMVKNPSKVLEKQLEYWGKSLKHVVEAQEVLRSGKLRAPEDHTPDDRRFANPLWKTHPYFNYIKQQYMIASEAVQDAVMTLDTMSPREKKRLHYFTQQIVDMMAPTNFLATNPDALMKAVETEGESLIKGLENLVHDIEAGGGELLVTLADQDAFRVGENLATMPGKVVFRNRMFELIQYAPSTEKVYRTPIVIFPPWINKFYIMDLKPQNSLIKWIVDQGYTLFVVSWVNPDARYADVGMDTYVEEGYLEAIRVAKEITGEAQVNAVGYCIAGTTLSLTLGLMNKRKDKSVRSATFFTTLTDFSDQGEVGVFLEDDFVDGIEAECNEKGYLDSFFMSRTFSFLRSNDLIYAPAIRSYMMGEAPPAFDLLYWNGDSTNLPGKMCVEYLRGLCQQDRFSAASFRICGEDVSISDVKHPLCAIACETDHIAAWRSSFRGMSRMGSRDKTFILSQSGHIAGIINPPSKKKYGHYTGAAPEGSPDDWKSAAEFHEGSWWPRWGDWLSRRSGAKVEARIPGDSSYPALDDAPGRYVVSSKNDEMS
ncbi:class I poly(R)-hydroxyalkanoic acid synthase [Roseinatronobacter alkalisoli]|uniref:Class I poly(R)-hydroxyalkanoic acid synthase n=1 Tax=Roseinatronobacter alkalisoli TaxID=3028235 RepID=A0ABT5T757_9RHOB|nr:class I poly(R)-hydroxyalkanoic acid synthase [Roseinatronobacter sp. HJB301]MDD7969783.1 class I poly(R)-hydroxyalkanoic acid synthase [Roseinatronobacter sp. HJB301]